MNASSLAALALLGDESRWAKAAAYFAGGCFFFLVSTVASE